MKNNKPIIKIYSHVRSGTHLLGEYLFNNFYKDYDLEIKPTKWGHWSNRITNEKGEKLGKLYGSHMFPQVLENQITEDPGIYIYRDGHAVVYSTWKTSNFKNIEHADVTFQDYLRTPIDWYGSPANKAEPTMFIVEHWVKHVSDWLSLTNPNFMFIRYEDLVNQPEIELEKIVKFFKFLEKPENFQLINKPVGLLPNKATVNSWEQVFTDDDRKFFNDYVPKNFIGLSNTKT